MSKDNKITVYVSEQTKQAVKQEAAASDTTQAEWVRDLIRRGLKESQEDRLMEETNAEARFESIAQETADAMIDSVRQIKDVMAVDANYSIVNFLILKQVVDGLNEDMIDDMFSTSSTRLREWNDELITESQRRQIIRQIQADDQQPQPPQQPQQQSTARASESHAQDGQQQQQQQQDSTDDTTSVDDILDNV